jgi:hypothetical protein
MHIRLATSHYNFLIKQYTTYYICNSHQPQIFYFSVLWLCCRAVSDREQYERRRLLPVVAAATLKLVARPGWHYIIQFGSLTELLAHRAQLSQMAKTSLRDSHDRGVHGQLSVEKDVLITEKRLDNRRTDRDALVGTPHMIRLAADAFAVSATSTD